MNHATDPAWGMHYNQQPRRGMHDNQQLCRGMHDNRQLCRECLHLVKRPAKPTLVPESRGGDEATVEDAIAVNEVVHLVEHALQQAPHGIRPMTT